jgi:hypothetical protein
VVRPNGKTYAEIILARINDPLDRKSIREVGRSIGFSYEHLRKVVRGELTFRRGFNNALCAYLRLDPDAMWQLAQTQRLHKRFEGADVGTLFPKDTRLSDIWKGLTPSQREVWLKVGEGWLRAQSS